MHPIEVYGTVVFLDGDSCALAAKRNMEMRDRKAARARKQRGAVKKSPAIVILVVEISLRYWHDKAATKPIVESLVFWTPHESICGAVADMTNEGEGGREKSL